MRLRTLPLSLSGIIMGSAVAYYTDHWDSIIFSLAMITTILFQIVSNLANDLGDGVKGTDNENRVGPDRMVQSGIITSKQMKGAVILTSILSLISALALLYVGSKDLPIGIIWFYVGLALFCIAAAITYTVGKKAYGYHGLGDLMVFIFFGLVSVLGVYSLFAKSFLFENILLACSVGLLSAAVLNLNNMRDFANDANSGKNTLVVKMGPNSAKFYHTTLIFLAIFCLAGFMIPFKNPILFVVLIPCILLIIHLRKVMMTKEPKDFDPELKKVALTTFLISLVLFVTLIFLKP